MTITISPDFADVDYEPGGSGASHTPRMNIYLPGNAVQPAEGWPVYVRFRMDADYLGSSKPSSLSSAVAGDLHFIRLIHAGFAFVDVETSYTDLSFQGGGLFLQFSLWTLVPTWDIPNRDAIWAIQKVRDLALTDFATYPLDDEKVVSESSSYLAPWAAMMPDFAGVDTGPGLATTQESRSSLVQACVVRRGAPFYVPAWCKSAGSGGVAINFLRGSGGGTGVGATDVNDCLATDVEQVSPLYLGSTNVGARLDCPFWIEAVGAIGDGAPLGTIIKTGMKSTALDLPAMVGTSTTGLAPSTYRDAWGSLMMMKMLRHVTQDYIAGIDDRRPVAYFHGINSRLVADESFDATLAQTVADAQFSSSARRDVDAEEWAWRFVGDCGGEEDFALNHDWAVTMGSRRAVIQSPPEHGALLRRQVQSSATRPYHTASTKSWRVGWRKATPAQRAQIESLVKNAGGQVRTFNFAPPDEGGCVRARFVGDLEVNQGAGRFYSMAVTVEVA